MKSKKELLKEQTLKEVKEDTTFNEIGMLLQAILMLFVVVFAVSSFFQIEFLVITEILLGLMMFVMAYNNVKVYKRRIMTYAYLAMGVVMIAASIINFIG